MFWVLFLLFTLDLLLAIAKWAAVIWFGYLGFSQNGPLGMVMFSFAAWVVAKVVMYFLDFILVPIGSELEARHGVPSRFTHRFNKAQRKYLRRSGGLD